MQDKIKDKITQLHLKDALLSFTSIESSNNDEESPSLATKTTKNQIKKLLETKQEPKKEEEKEVLLIVPDRSTTSPIVEEPYDPRPLFQRLASLKEKEDVQKEEYHKSLNTQKTRDDQEFMFLQMDEVKRLESVVKIQDDLLMAAFRKDVGVENERYGLLNKRSEAVKVKRVYNDKQKTKVGLSIVKKVKVDESKVVGLVVYSDSE